MDSCPTHTRLRESLVSSHTLTPSSSLTMDDEMFLKTIWMNSYVGSIMSWQQKKVTIIAHQAWNVLELPFTDIWRRHWVVILTIYVDGDKFASSNQMLAVMSGLRLSEGGEKKGFVATEENDLESIFASFNRETSEVLQNEVMFSSLYFLGEWGREELWPLKRSNVEFVHDSTGENFFHIKSKDEQ